MPASRHQRRSASRRSAARRSQARRSGARSAEAPRSSAPRRTQPVSTGANRSRIRRWIYLGVSVLIAVLVIGGFALGGIPNLGGGGSGQQGQASEPVDGIGQAVDTPDDASHFPEEFTITDINEDGYTTTPPTSGRHWPRWASCGFYRDGIAPGSTQLADEVIVHNMEHGNIVVSYNLADEAQIDALEVAFNDIGQSGQWGVARYYDRIPAGAIALTTWGVIDQWNVADDGINKDRIEQFFGAYSGQLGPEFPNGSPCTIGGSMGP